MKFIYILCIVFLCIMFLCIIMINYNFTKNETYADLRSRPYNKGCYYQLKCNNDYSNDYSCNYDLTCNPYYTNLITIPKY